jgi:sec-independent protein translocase protein TatB
LFDVGFSELIVIAVIALVVIGPEKLPKVARAVGAITGRLQRYVNGIKADIEREMQMEELQKLQQEIRQSASEVQAGFKQAETELKDARQLMDSSAASQPSKAPNPDVQ